MVEISDLRFYYTPLMPGDKLTASLPPIGGAGSVATLNMKAPGNYRIWIEFNSSGPIYEGLIWPIWRGDTRSNTITISLAAPGEEEISHWRERLSKCYKSGEICADFEAISFFKSVKDPRAAATLRSLAKEQYLENPLIIEALVAQENPEDSAILEALAADADLDPRTRDHFMQLAQKLRDPELPCRSAVEAVDEAVEE